MKNIIIICPNCNEHILIEKIRCGVFRHGVIKKTNKPIHPHLSKNKCDYLIKKNEIFGCGKPFLIKVIQNENAPPTVEVNTCEYI